MKDELTQADIGKYVEITTSSTKIDGKIIRIEQDRIEIKQFPDNKKITISKDEIVAVHKWELQPVDIEDEKDEP